MTGLQGAKGLGEREGGKGSNVQGAGRQTGISFHPHLNILPSQRPEPMARTASELREAAWGTGLEPKAQARPHPGCLPEAERGD